VVITILKSKKNNFSTTVFNFSPSFATGFSIFAFAFGATAIFPNIYVKMSNRPDWPKAIIGGYLASLSLYAPISIIGYLVYGAYLGNSSVSTILDAILAFDTSTAVVVKICSGVMMAHIISAFPIVVNPIFLVLEERFTSNSKWGEFLTRLIIRGIMMAILIVIAVFFPYFLEVMSLLSCISVSLTGFILPCLFYWKICHPNLLEMIILLAVIVFGIVGSGVGIYESSVQLYDKVKENPNPFKDIFTFG